MSQSTLSPVEHIKQRSRHLRGSIVDSLANRVTGALADDDTQLIKFHGSYQQDDRDQREERRLAKLEPAYSFMIRTRTPGGVCTPLQWLALDAIAQTYGNGSLRLTTRQAFQFHGVIKRELKATIAAINRSLMDTIAACGDVNRNVMASANPVETRAHGVAYEWAVRLSEHLLPKTRAYAEIWLDGELVTGESGARAALDATTSGRPEPGEDLVPRAPEHSPAAKSDAPDLEPIYGTTYLPRKFKAAIAVPPINDVDVYAHDLGFIALIEDGVLVGFNVSVGGGLGATHGDPSTYPRRGSVIGSILPEQLLRVAEAVVTTQRDWGNRENRKQSRLKYTIDRVGLDVFKREVEARSGVVLAPERTVVFTQSGDRFGWIVGHDGRWHLNLRIEAGRISDVGEQRWASALRAIAEVHKGDFRITPNQNLIVANVAHGDRAQIDALLAEHGVHDGSGATPLRQRALACVSLPTCPLAMAEAERYLPELLGKIEALLASHSLGAEPISLRITGCPNGCARPYLAEIGLVGKAPGRYNLHLGGDLIGERLNALAHENIDEAQILSALDGWFARYTAERQARESFGDFTRRVHKELL